MTLLNNSILNQLQTEGSSGSINEFLYSLFLLVFITYLVKFLYIKRSRTVGDKEYFASFFLIWTVSIFLIISVIKSSVVLSLGMVGALSIVRFRNAIKDTEQIMYLLFLISISMALASNQYIYTVIIVIVLVSLIYLRDVNKNTTSPSKFIYLQLSKKDMLNEILERLSETNNKIVSIEQNENNIDINATLNNLNDKEIIDLLKWLSERTNQQRISTTYFL
jgi:hypothetical protein